MIVNAFQCPAKYSLLCRRQCAGTEGRALDHVTCALYPNVFQHRLAVLCPNQ